MSTVPSTQHPQFSVSVVPDRDEVAVVLTGGVDVASAYEVEQTGTDLFERGFEVVVADLAAVDFIDSTGLRALLRLRDRAAEGQGRLTLIPPRKRVALRIFDVSGTYGLFDWRE